MASEAPQRGDQVSLRGISAYGYHGVFDFERKNGQPFVVDVTCWLDLGRAAASDDLTDTLDYSQLATAIVADVEGPPLNLIEALAGRIADTCLDSPLVNSVEVTVHKPEAPIDLAKAANRHAEVADVAVTLTRSKNS
jgi:dihydroneopterin aldolase